MPVLLIVLSLLSFGAELENTATESALVADSVLCFDLVSQDGSLHLLLGQPGGDDRPMTFSYLRRKAGTGGGAGGWSDPITLTLPEERPYPHHRGSDARLAVNGSHVLAVWTNAGRGAMGSGEFACARSSDGGKSWQRGSTPGADSFDTSAKHGRRFPALAGDPLHPARFHLAWIDAFGEERRLGYARSDDGGQTWSATQWLDSHICACCWNRMLVTPAGDMHLLYRDHEPSEMALASIDHAQEQNPRTVRVSDFQWLFEGCPHVGGALTWRPPAPGGGVGVGAGAGVGELHALVWTGTDNRLGLYHTRSDDEGRTWSGPSLLSGAGKHSDLVADARGRLLAAWDQPHGEGRVIMLSRWLDLPGRWSDPRMMSPGDRWASHPRLATTPDGFVLAWTEHHQSRVGTLRMVDLPPDPGQGHGHGFWPSFPESREPENLLPRN